MKGRLLRVVLVLILGMVLGAAATNIYAAARLDQLILANAGLQAQLADARRELEKLKESTAVKKRNAVTALGIFIAMDSREALTDFDRLSVELEAEKKVKEWLNPVIGQEVEELDSLLIPRVVDNREIEANGNKYTLKTVLVVVNRKTSVYVKATRLKQGAKLH